MPIGLIQDCWGGTPAESWMNGDTLHQLKDFDAPLAEIARLHAKGGPEYGSFLMHWLDENDPGIVSSPEVARYAWQANPEATLFNGAGLPATPFRTHDWPGSTDHSQPW